MRFPVPARLRRAWKYHIGRWVGWWKASSWNRLLVVLILVYGIVFSVLTSLRVLALSAFAWDLGLYNQAMYTTVRFGRFFFISGFPGSAPQSLFGGHMSPILFLLLPLYALVPSPFTLVVLQTWGVAVAALPLYLLGKAVLRSDRMAFVFALIFLLHPATQGVNWFDFHAEAFLLPTMSAALFFLETRRWRWFVVASVLVLSTIEAASPILAVVALGALASEWLGTRKARDRRDRTKIRVLVGIVLLCIVWYVMAMYFVRLVNPLSDYYGGGTTSWSILGASSIASVPIQILLHPNLAISALAYDGTAKVLYLIVLFAPVQFLTLRSPRACLYCVPWLGLSLFSNWPSYYLVGNQYPSFILPFLFYGAVVGLARPWSPPTSIRRPFRRLIGASQSARPQEGYVRVMVGITLVLLVVVSPIGPWGLGADNVGRFPMVGAHDQAVLALYGIIPADASVLTQNNLFPLLSNRLNVYFAPVNFQFPPGASFNHTMDTLVGAVDYILLDTQTSYIEAALLLYWPNVSKEYSLVGAADGAMLLERGVHPISYFEPFQRTFDCEQVTPANGTLVSDPAATNGIALFHANITTSHFWYGPYTVLAPGSYRVSYRLKVDRQPIGSILGLPVVFRPVPIMADVLYYIGGAEEVFFTTGPLTNQTFAALHMLSNGDVPSPVAYFWVSTQFNVTSLGEYDFPGHAASGSVQLWFDELTVVQETATTTGTIPIAWSSA